MKKYYTLLSRENADDRWVIDFGDYDKSVVEDEKRDRKEGFLPRGTQFKIIATSDEQSAIDAKIAELNA